MLSVFGAAIMSQVCVQAEIGPRVEANGSHFLLTFQGIEKNEMHKNYLDPYKWLKPGSGL